VVVGVRVRPYNDREKGLGATLCIDMQGASTVITSPAGQPQTFNFDQSFWSHDEFDAGEDGYCSPKPGGRYADQRYVFESFGQRVLDNAWEGFHCCLFAYGQTGAGKSYSMVGYGTNKGIVPISCEEIFNRIAANTNTEKSYEVQLSMVEIYNETVQDLFIPWDSRPKNGFQIRESKALGIYVDGVVKHAVDSYAAIERVIDQGTANRSVGSTAMNATSSRAHTVITIEFKSVERMMGVENVKVSNINLIDLAGSEKAGQTGATGDRLKEGSAINKSLSALGNVIEKLAEKSSSPKKGKEVLIPYRDSKLTRLLQNALGGSSKTIMICALSPASSNYEETLSTLRYADRAKKIKNSAVVNENPQEKLMREMREENEKLKAMLAGVSGEGGGDLGGDLGGGGGGGGGMVDEVALQAQQDQIAQLEQMLAEQQKGFSQKLEESKRRDEDFQTRQTLRGGNVGMGNPIIVNLNAEMQLTGKLRFEFFEGKPTLIGGTMCGSSKEGSTEGSDSDVESESASSDDENDSEEEEPGILLSSPGVQAKHAKVENRGSRCYLTPMGECAKSTWINGVSVADILLRREERLKEKEEWDGNDDDEKEAKEEDDDEDCPEGQVVLKHCDRLVLGKAIFLFVDPQQGIAEMIIMSGIYSYARARKELPASWKGTVEKGGDRLKAMMANIRNAVKADGYGGGATSSATKRRESDSGGAEGAAGDARRGSDSSDDRRSDNLDADSDSQSSLGDGANADEVLIKQLKDEIISRDREIVELKNEISSLNGKLEAKDKDILGGFGFSGTEGSQSRARTASSVKTVASMKGTLSASRAAFHEKVAALDATFRDALAALDHTRTSLSNASVALEAEGPKRIPTGRRQD